MASLFIISPVKVNVEVVELIGKGGRAGLGHSSWCFDVSDVSL